MHVQVHLHVHVNVHMYPVVLSHMLSVLFIQVIGHLPTTDRYNVHTHVQNMYKLYMCYVAMSCTYTSITCPLSNICATSFMS